jgi:very-short-patch-repair endonuclease
VTLRPVQTATALLAGCQRPDSITPTPVNSSMAIKLVRINALRKAVPGGSDQVLVAILNNPHDLALAHDKHWYRIPVSSAERWLRRRWPPRWLAFYQTKVFGPEAFAIHYYGQVLEIREVCRKLLFPDQPKDPKAFLRYYQLFISPLQRLAQPIPSHRQRRVVFIQTTWQKLMQAAEINDLYDDSPLENRLWAELKRLELRAERQDFISVNNHDYALDFAFYCASGKLDVETDGDIWHADPHRIPEDNLRDNDLETGGWKLLRFNTCQVNEQMTDYCLPTIVKNVQGLGGLEPERLLPRDIRLDPAAPSQLSLFDDWQPPMT